MSSVDVAAAAVDDDDLVTLCAQRLQRRQRRRDARGFLERGNDDRQAKRIRGADCGRAARGASTDVGEECGGRFAAEAQA